MMHFSPRLLCSKVELEVDDGGAPVVAHGEIITLYEGKQWTAMAQVLMFDGPGKGRVATVPLGLLVFPKVAYGGEGE